MHEEINSYRLFVRSIFRRNEYDYRYYWLAPMEIYLNDMGINLYRTNNWVSEYFGVYSPQRLKGLHEERKVIAETGHAPRRFYFSMKMTVVIVLALLFFCFYL